MFGPSCSSVDPFFANGSSSSPPSRPFGSTNSFGTGRAPPSTSGFGNPLPTFGNASFSTSSFAGGPPSTSVFGNPTPAFGNASFTSSSFVAVNPSGSFSTFRCPVAPSGNSLSGEPRSSFPGFATGGAKTSNSDDAEKERIVSISATDSYLNKSHEELRAENYRHQRNKDASSSMPFNGGCSACEARIKSQTSFGHTSTDQSQSQAPAPAPVPIQFQTPIVNLNGHGLSIGNGIALIPTFVNCINPAFGAFGLHGGSPGSLSLNSLSGTTVFSFPVLFPTSSAFQPQQIQVSGPSSTLPIPLSYSQTNATTPYAIGFNGINVGQSSSLPLTHETQPSLRFCRATTQVQENPRQFGSQYTTLFGSEPLFGSQPTSLFSKPTPLFGSQPTSLFGSQPTSLFGSQPTSLFSKPTSLFGSQSTPSCSSQSTPSFTPFVAFTSQSTPSLGSQSTPSLGSQSTPSYNSFVFPASKGVSGEQNYNSSISTPSVQTSNPPFGISTPFGSHPFPASTPSVQNIDSSFRVTLASNPPINACCSNFAISTADPFNAFLSPSKTRQAKSVSDPGSSIPKGLELIVQNLGVNPWEDKHHFEESEAKQILPCEDASNDADIIALAEFAVQQHNAMDKDHKVKFSKVKVACLEAVDGGRYHIVLEAKQAVPSPVQSMRRFYAAVLRKKTDRPNHVTLLEKWVPGIPFSFGP